MNSLQNDYCEECDNDLEIKYKNLKKKINIENEKINFIPINLQSLPNYYCENCDDYNHKLNKCPSLINICSLKFNNNYTSSNKTNKTNKRNKLIKKNSILKNPYINTSDFDINNQFSNLQIKLSTKNVKFNLSTAH